MPLPCRPAEFRKCKHDGLQLLARGSANDLLQLCLRHSEMVLVQESRRTNSLDFANGRKVIHLHDKGLSAIVATISNTTKNRHLLESDDWLSNSGNRVLLSCPVDPSA